MDPLASGLLPTNETSLKDAAIAYAKMGLLLVVLHTPLFFSGALPGCSCGNPSCASQGKHPRLRGWQKKAAASLDMVGRWWGRMPEANIGLAMGGERRLIAIDIDGADGFKELAKLEAIHSPLPPTLTSRSGRAEGGEHRIFTVHSAFPMPGNRARVVPGVDVRGEGGQIVVAPSVHPTGARYEWIDTREPAELPRWLYELIMRKSAPPKPLPSPARAPTLSTAPGTLHPYLRAALNDEVSKLLSTAPGEGRDTQLYASACALGQLVVGGGLDEHLVVSALTDAAQAVGLPDDKQIPRQIQRGLEVGAHSPRSIPDEHKRATKVNARPDWEALGNVQPCEGRTKYMERFELKGKLVVVKASMGSGKTFQCKRHVDAAFSVSVITPRISLTTEACNRYDLLSYLDYDGLLPTDGYQKVGVCINSAARRIISTGVRYHEAEGLVVIDEIEQVINVLFSGFLGRREMAVYRALRDLLRGAEHVVIMDAFASQQSVEIVQNMMGISDEDTQWVEHQGVDTFERVVHHESFDALLSRAVSLLGEGKRLAIPCTSATDVCVLEELLSQQGAKVLALHKDADEETKETLSDINAAWSRYDVVLYSPVVASGVSFDIPDYFDHVLLFARYIPGLCANDILQMTPRVRQCASGDLDVWIDNRQFDKPTDLTTLLRESLQAQELSIALTVEVGEDGKPSLLDNPLAKEHTYARCLSRQVNNERSNNILGFITEHFRQRGVPQVQAITHKAHAKALGGEAKRVRKDQRSAKILAIATALIMSSVETAKQVLKQPATPAERRSALKTIIHDTCGQSDEATVGLWLHDKLQSKLHRFVNQGFVSVSSPLDITHDPRLSAGDKAAILSGDPAALKHTTAQAHTIAAILTAAGLNHTVLFGPLRADSSSPPSSPEELEEWSKEVGEWSKDKLVERGFVEFIRSLESTHPFATLFGGALKVRRDFETNPSTLVRDTLKLLGLSTKTRKTTLRGKTARSHSIDPLSLERMSRLSARLNRRRRAIHPAFQPTPLPNLDPDLSQPPPHPSPPRPRGLDAMARRNNGASFSKQNSPPGRRALSRGAEKMEGGCPPRAPSKPPQVLGRSKSATGAEGALTPPPLSQTSPSPCTRGLDAMARRNNGASFSKQNSPSGPGALGGEGKGWRLEVPGHWPSWLEGLECWRGVEERARAAGELTVEMVVEAVGWDDLRLLVGSLGPDLHPPI